MADEKKKVDWDRIGEVTEGIGNAVGGLGSIVGSLADLFGKKKSGDDDDTSSAAWPPDPGRPTTLILPALVIFGVYKLAKG